MFQSILEVARLDFSRVFQDQGYAHSLLSVSGSDSSVLMDWMWWVSISHDSFQAILIFRVLLDPGPEWRHADPCSDRHGQTTGIRT